MAVKPPKAIQPFTVVSAPNGVYHVYPNGRRVFVPNRPMTAGKPPTGTPSPMAGVSLPKMTPTATPTLGAPAAPSAPAAAPGASAPAAAPGANPYAPDSTYYATDAKLNFDAQQGLNNLNQQSAYDKTDLTEALRRLLEQQPKDVQNAREAANRQGLLYSGHLGQQVGDINTGYVRSQSDQQQGYDRREAARAAARHAIEAGLPIDEAAALAASVDRSTVRDTGLADAGALPAVTPLAPTPAAAAPPVKPKTYNQPKPKKKKKAAAMGPGLQLR